MKTWFIALSLISASALSAFQGVPRCTAVDPETAKTGDTVNVTCENLGKASFADVFLTDEKDDIKVTVMDHTADKLRIQVPNVKPGRYHLEFLTANKASMVEQPVVLTVQ